MKNLSFAFRPLESWDLVVVLALLAVYGLFVVRAWAAGGTRRERLTVLGFRTAALLLVAVVFLQPSVERGTRAKNVALTVVVDRSASMGTADAGPAAKEKRWNAVLAALQESRPFLEKYFSPSYYVVDQALKPIPWPDLQQAQPKGLASDLSRLEEVPRDRPEVRAVLLFSDGRWGGGRDPLPSASRLGVPLYAFGAGRADTAPDLLVEAVRAPHFAYKRTDVEVTVRVEKRRLEANTVTVEILQEGAPVTSGRLEFSTAAAAAETTLKFRPQKLGPQTYTVRVPAYEAETNRANNTRAFTLDVLRDRIRVLYICGQPGPHYNFLRYQLKANPSVELVSFVILRDPEDVMSIPEQELALIPFPTQDILFEQLKSFELVILEQFSFSNFGIAPQNLAALRDYVERGGGLLFLGNHHMLGPASPYRQTPLDDLLPLRPDTVSSGAQRFVLQAYEPDHPVMALSDDPGESRRLWEQMPALEGNGSFLTQARPGSLVLAGLNSPEGPRPVLAARKRGRGRVMAFLSLASWRWALVEAGRGHGTWAYQRFWGNVVRWMSASDDFRLVRLDVPRETVPVGSDILLRAFVRDENYRPLAAGQVLATVKGPEGSVWRKPLKPAAAGEYGEVLRLDHPGSYRVTAHAYVQQKNLGQDERVLRVGLDWEENRDTGTDFSFLEELAETSGGEFSRLEDFSSSWLQKRLDSLAWTYTRAESLWNSGAVLASLVLLLFAEWIWRRRRGYL
jgi:uncharacterized membrane protein